MPAGVPPNPTIAAGINAIAEGVLHAFMQHFPNGFIDPVTPVNVQRTREDGTRVVCTTNMAQLLAELNDNIIRLSDLTEDALEDAEEDEEEEYEPPTRKRRKK